MSRSTWACELKLPVTNKFTADTSHAPRERVSWNLVGQPWFSPTLSHAPRERVSWNCFICYTFVPIFRSRSTWACELKSPLSVSSTCLWPVTLHVSVWVEISLLDCVRNRGRVTLHVSVWVEMMIAQKQRFVKQSRSTWACELKLTAQVGW